MNNCPTVALVKCSTYSSGLTEPIRTLLAKLGGITAFVRPGQSVLIKPNLLTDKAPSDAVTTHPEVVRAIIHIVKEAGANPIVADSPANAVKIERVWEKTGFRSMCNEENIPLINLEKEGSITFDLDKYSFSISNLVFDTDVIINVPKVKTHILTTFTAAVKNMYGLVPGFQKTNLHKLHPKPDDFGKLLTEIFAKIRPHLNIADAITGMEGDGPSAGNPIQLGFLAASDNATALDLTLCSLLGIRTESVPYLRPFINKGKLHKIKIEGAHPDDIAIKSFKVPSTVPARLIPGWLVKIIGPFLWIRPSVSDKCVVCGKCGKACPVHALTIEDKQPPVLDHSKCIECCCCHEVCPEHAISMTQSPLLNFIRKGKLP